MGLGRAREGRGNKAVCLVDLLKELPPFSLLLFLPQVPTDLEKEERGGGGSKFNSSFLCRVGRIARGRLVGPEDRHRAGRKKKEKPSSPFRWSAKASSLPTFRGAGAETRRLPAF